MRVVGSGGSWTAAGGERGDQRPCGLGGARVTEGAPVQVVAGGGPRSQAPWGSTAEVFPRRGARAAGAPGLERGPAGAGGGRSPARALGGRPGSVRSGEVALRGGGGLRAGGRGLVPAPERTEVQCRFPRGAPARPSAPSRCLGKGVCVCRDGNFK